MNSPTASKLADSRLVEQYARSQAALQASEERPRLAMEAADLGTWDWDIANDRVSWSDAVFRMHGVTPDGFGGSVADFARIVHDDDRPRVQQQIKATLADGTPYASEFRVVWPDGTIRWLSTRAHLERDAAGAPKRMVGATYDVTERVQLLAAERTARAEAEAARQRLELLASASMILSGSLQPQATLLRLAEILIAPAAGSASVSPWSRTWSACTAAASPRRAAAPGAAAGSRSRCRSPTASRRARGAPTQLRLRGWRHPPAPHPRDASASSSSTTTTTRSRRSPTSSSSTTATSATPASRSTA